MPLLDHQILEFFQSFQELQTIQYIIYLKMIRIVVCFLMVFGVLTAYSPPQAQKFMVLAAASYDSPDSINTWTCPNCHQYSLSNPQVFEISGLLGYTAFLPEQNAIVIVFRGSQNLNNWISNIDTIKTSYDGCPGCKVHKGFYLAYQKLSPLVRAGVQRLLDLYKSAKIYITGHSLGGALAVLCSLQMKSVYGKADLLYTMGQPRVGDSDFAFFSTMQVPNFYRVVNYADIVVHSPPKAFSFEHSGNEIWYSPRGMQTYIVCSSEDSSCANSISTLKFSTSDHSLDNYRQIKINSSILENIIEFITQFRRQWLPSQSAQFNEEELVQIQLNNYFNVIGELKLEQASNDISYDQ